MQSRRFCRLPLWLLIGAAGASPVYRDLNHNSRMNPYEDPRLTPEDRADDLISRMTLEEKLGAIWPETLGMAALADPERVRRFGDIARREYRAVSIHMALSPQADLATEPRWPRTTATFGDDPALEALDS